MNPHLQFNGIEKRYGRVEALRGVTFDVPRGCVLGLLGPNGAGKSTLFGCLLGIVQASRGRVVLNGSEITDQHRRRFGYVAERVALYSHRTVIDNATFFAALRGQSSASVPPQLARVGLSELRERKVRTLSKGLLQRLGLAIALVGQPELLILDEPFNGLDPALLDQLHEILREERQRGATLLISTHTMSAIEPLASHIGIVLDGRLAAFGTLEELRTAHGEQSLERIYHRIARDRARDTASAISANHEALRPEQETTVRWRRESKTALRDAAFVPSQPAQNGSPHESANDCESVSSKR